MHLTCYVKFAHMNYIQMLVTTVACLESLHAHPADVRPASWASDVVASRALLDWNFALGTISDAEKFLCFLKSSIATRRDVFVFSACHLGVRDVTLGAYCRQAVGTCEYSSF